ncbi:hypothetical protein [Desulfovibrio sp. JC022]|uniref:hypothetical protein n=1 Tax=Desulfovibrio sp. JC022 TaxID=2593642 RepID=UPI0013D04A94|nr:hypothetical protein [Desulfovibrio sp. JC022]NDV24590.1 hypothetical protein [Desulfovibrio sp. JC022]
MDNLELVLNAVSVYQAQIDQVDKIWNYFSVVSLTVVGIILNSDKAVRTMKEPLVIIAAYLIFCINNHLALVKFHKQLDQLGALVASLKVNTGDKLTTFGKQDIDWTQESHILFIIAVCAGSLLTAWIRIKNHKK